MVPRIIDIKTKIKLNAMYITVLPLLMGVFSFIIVVGPNVLNPMNVAWLGDRDSATHYLGWHFFRYSDWLFPIGLNPTYGLELGSSILHSDSIPLLALVFKPFSSILPEPFQYFGIWFLACFILQTWFGWKLMGLATNNSTIRLLAAGLFVFAPPMIWRLIDHCSLVGHFLILAALYLALRPNQEKRWIAWVAVLMAAALVHPYLLAMVTPIWLADLAWQTLKRPQLGRKSLVELMLLVGALGITCWQVGYFSFDSFVSNSGYGLYRMNLLSIIDPSSWSYFLPDIPQGKGDYEGFNFLGAGVILLILFSVLYFRSGRAKMAMAISIQPFLLMVFVGLTVFALSNMVGIGSYNFEYSLPEPLLRLASIFRGSGRMFWPVFYAMIFSVILLIVCGNDRRTTIFLLALALVVQILDTRAGWGDIRTKLMAEPASEWASPLKNAFWLDAATKYNKLRLVWPRVKSPYWPTLATYAATHDMATNAVYLGRVGKSALAMARANAATSMLTGKYEPDSLYVIEDNLVIHAMVHLKPAVDLLANVDGFNVLAPGWKTCIECRPVASELKVDDLIQRFEIGVPIQFSQSGTGLANLTYGWSRGELWGTWSNGSYAEIVLPMPDNARGLLIEAKALVSPSHPKQDIEIRLNGVLAATISLTMNTGNRIEVPIPVAVQKAFETQDLIPLQFHFLDAARPKDIGLNDDTRILALGLQSITVY